jgi:hypothetical protein
LSRYVFHGFPGIDSSGKEHDDFLDEIVRERSEKNPNFQALLEEAGMRLSGHGSCLAPDCFGPACLRSDADFIKLRAAIYPLVEQLAATAYAMGRRDEREAAEETAKKGSSMSKYYVKTASYLYPVDPPEGIIDPAFFIFPTFEEAFAQAQAWAPSNEDPRVYHKLIEVGFFSPESPVVGIEALANATHVSMWPPRKRWTEKSGWVDLNEALYRVR